MNETTDTQDPAAIEQEIRRTQDSMSRTVDRIGTQLTPRNLFNMLLDQADSNNIDARSLLDGARRNPLALAMLAGGAIWLVSDHDAKLPKRAKPADDGSRDPHHRDYLAHMDKVEWREGEDHASYQSRRDMARASYLMIERNPGEDDHGFRQRLDAATEKFREKRDAWADKVSSTASSVRDTVQGTAGSVRDRVQGTAGSMRDTMQGTGARARNLFDENPIIGGLLAAAAGAIAGISVPLSRVEEDRLGDVGGKARAMMGEQAGRLTATAREAMDKGVQMASNKIAAAPPEPATTDHG